MKMIVMWFRRDLRLRDNAALYHAFKKAEQANARVIAMFIYDREILDLVRDRDDPRIKVIHDATQEMNAELRALGSRLLVKHGRARDVMRELLARLAPNLIAIYTNHDYEPRRMERDVVVQRLCQEAGVEFRTFKDHVIFEKLEVLTNDGRPYRVYSPFAKAWYRKLDEKPDFYLKPYPTVDRFATLLAPAKELPADDPWASLQDLNFNLPKITIDGTSKAARQAFDDYQHKLDEYADTRDRPDLDGVSRLGVYLRFGQLSIRHVMQTALDRATRGARKWADELIWREFYQYLLYHYPSSEHEAFDPKFRDVEWDDYRSPQNAEKFAAWCEGRTGYPVVDAAMRGLNSQYWMHNRLRMIVASFLTKDLHIHWKAGERYFSQKLLDYDLASNVGGWQWAASTGADGQPYFRIFNPVSQGEKHDPDGKFVRTHCPELADLESPAIHAPWDAKPLELLAAGVTLGETYPLRIVNHAAEREEALRRFQLVKAHEV